MSVGKVLPSQRKAVERKKTLARAAKRIVVAVPRNGARYVFLYAMSLDKAFWTNPLIGGMEKRRVLH